MNILLLLVLLSLTGVTVGAAIREKRAADKDETYRWPSNTIRYLINTDKLDESDVAVIKGAMEEYEKYSCIKFQEITFDEMAGDYIIINKGVGCYSITGRASGQQNLEVNKKCISHKRLLHYLAHAIGLNHENVRPDRDDYITVYSNNILVGKELNFNKMNESKVDTFGIPYDYNSIMHLGPTDFAKNGTVTITTKGGLYDDIIGKALHPSFRDWKLVNYMYTCNRHCVDADEKQMCSAINEENYLDKNCVCICPGPSPNQTTVRCSEKQTLTTVETKPPINTTVQPTEATQNIQNTTTETNPTTPSVIIPENTTTTSNETVTTMETTTQQPIETTNPPAENTTTPMATTGFPETTTKLPDITTTGELHNMTTTKTKPTGKTSKPPKKTSKLPKETSKPSTKNMKFCKEVGKRNGMYANVADDCRSYYWCVGAKTYLMQCGSGTRFRNAISVCDHSRNVDCVAQSVV